MTTRRRESAKRVMVVLQGERVSADDTGVVPLRRAIDYVSNAEDEILVLTLLSPDGCGPSSSSKGFNGDHRCCNYRREHDPYIRSLSQRLGQRKEDYKRIFRRFYERCKHDGVKFTVKIAVGFPPKNIITEEANNIGATWIIMDSFFAKHLTFRLSGIDCNVSLVSDEPKSSIPMEATSNPKSPKMIKGSKSEKESTVCYDPSTSREIVLETNGELVKENETPGLVKPEFMVEKPQQLSWEAIERITAGFSKTVWNDDQDDISNNSFYTGCYDHRSVLVEKLAAYSSSIFEAEMRAASSMCHNNIMTLTGYHHSENGTILIFPLLQGMPLDDYVRRSRRIELEFEARLKIGLGIAQGLRYMHEECSQGPVVHGDLQPSNIFLGRDLQPKIYGFRKAKWLNFEGVSSYSQCRSFLTDRLNCESMEMVKSDILSFGVLLLRLFCRTSAPEDDKSLIEWARPLILKRKFHELLEEDSEFWDMHGIYRVMAAATACTRTKPISRPYMTQVIRLLKGEQFCDMPTSPSDTST